MLRKIVENNLGTVCVAELANLKFSLLFLVFMGVLRWIFNGSLSGSIDISFNVATIASVSWHGAHYDLKLALFLWLSLSVFVTVPAFFSRFRMAAFFRRFLLTGFVGIALLSTAASREFFLEYGDTFDIRLFDGVNDDYGAIFQTLINAYHLVENLVAVLFLTLLYAIVLHPRAVRWAKKPVIWREETLLGRLWASGLFLLVVFGFAFSLAFGPLEAVDKEAKRFHSKVLNASVIPGPIAFYKVFYEYRLKLKAYDANLYDRTTIQNALKEIAPGTTSLFVDDHFRKTVSGEATLVEKPRHVFVLLMERYDSWPLLPKYQSLGVTEGMQSLIREGVHWHHFLPGSTNTMPSLQTILMGLPYINLEAQHFNNVVFPGGIAHSMKELGYKTRFFYSGLLGWSQVGLVAKSQGFDQVFGSDVAMTHYRFRNEWGIDDQSLFEFVSQTVATDPEPSFNLILTSTNHPPYNLNLKEFQVPVEKIDQAVEKTGYSNGSKGVIVNKMGHLWYSDREMINFISGMRTKEPSALFAITGDHFSRAHVHTEVSLYEQSSVPLVLYGPPSLKQLPIDTNQPGSHLDIAPTLVELLAPRGFSYTSMGHSLVGSAAAPFAFGSGDVILTDRYIAKQKSLTSAQSLDQGATIQSPPENTRYLSLMNAIKAVAWWRMLHGNSLKGDE